MNVKTACEILLNGNCLILPSDTVYGLAAVAYNYEAVKKIFEIKRRDLTKPLPIHFHSIAQLANDAIITDEIMQLASQHWPGAVTIIMKKKMESRVQFVNETIAARIPNHKILLEILRTIDLPLVMTSANISGTVMKSKFCEISEELGIDGIEDDANLSGIPSKIIDCYGCKLR